MAGYYFRNDGWKDDSDLKEKLSTHVNQGIQRLEILDFMKRDFDQYTWSLRTLCRRLSHFDIRYTDSGVSLNEIKEAVGKELDGPGKQLGYRAMHQKIRQQHHLNVPRDVVYATMTELDQDGLEGRALGSKKKQKGQFTTKGVDWVHSLDGHCKLMGYQRFTFPLAVYGCMDSASRKLLWLRVWTDNCDPKLVARWYFDYLYERRIIASIIRIDKGTETGDMATLHAYLHRNHGDINPEDTVVYGKSTSNQIERWWRELHDRLEKYYKQQLRWLLDQGHYQPENALDRKILAFIFIPVLQREMETFMNMWNTHRIRPQKDTFLPNGVLNHIYNFPVQYNLEACGLEVSEEDLKDAATQSGVLACPEDFLEFDCRNHFQEHIHDVDEIAANDCVDAYLFLRDKISER